MKLQKGNFIILCVSALGIALLILGCTSQSNQGIGVAAKDAVHIIEELPEVAQYKETLKAAGKTARIEAEDSDTGWSIHVFEVVADEDSSHTATFGWWEVNKITGEVTKDF